MLMTMMILDQLWQRRRRTAEDAYLRWIVQHAGIVIDVILIALTIGALLEAWEWLEVARAVPRLTPR